MTDYDALIREGRRLRPMLELNEGSDDGSTLYSFATWAVEFASRAADAIEGLSRAPAARAARVPVRLLANSPTQEG
jgi:hypothetical protein